MSREAAEDGRPDVAEEIERAAMVSEGAESGEACVTDEASEPLDPHVSPLTSDDDEASPDGGSMTGAPLGAIALRRRRD